MAIKGGYLSCSSGILEFPWGTNKNTIQVIALKPAQESVQFVQFEGPGQDGYANGCSRRPLNVITLQGYYVAADATSQIGLTGIRGDMRVQLGTGQIWEGECVLLSSRFEGKWGQDYGQQQKPKYPKVQMVVRFLGPVIRTPVSAGV